MRRCFRISPTYIYILNDDDTQKKIYVKKKKKIICKDGNDRFKQFLILNFKFDSVFAIRMSNIKGNNGKQFSVVVGLKKIYFYVTLIYKDSNDRFE